MGELQEDHCRTPTLRSLSRLLLTWEKAELGAAERIAAARRVDEAVAMVRLATEIAAHRELVSTLCLLLEHPEEVGPLPRSPVHASHPKTDAHVLSRVRQRALGR